MTYPPKIHQNNEINHIIDVIKSYPLATVISIKDNVPFITHLPLVYNEVGKLIGHIDKQNPQVPLLKDSQPVTVLFSGPQCYISPSIYATTQLPTWNYIKVHLKGTVNAIESKEALKESIIKMTEFLEAPEHKYVLEPDNPRMLGALDYIDIFEITIDSWEGKFKLSQDKKPQDIQNARAELIRANQESIEHFLNKVF
ncbi:Protease synthase and sporulation protein PAI 2 [Mariniflexile rhizosphaerae]|uniref:FMN-binding negative transcriptional regulator n=1 Tax=unclassified Mariniflexile TaxID=2643887 RepID=UPI000CC0F7C3|nr:FMN-binding negative transcriptional regulator [Mariniflexile sp. TRM1-10]AXP79610.1 Protease synthase and sporulation protein PAI 2 [Mariniflexile sp. TRM1-10]PLB18554.1 MAG: Transcriptional regulator [Flavobacteriaceae bacterium FS1-H7996/R]